MADVDGTATGERSQGRLGAMWRTWIRTAVRPRLRILRMLPTGGLAPVAGLVVFDLVLGLLPVAFVVASGVVVGRVPAAVDGGVGSAAWSALVAAFVVAATTFGLQQILTPVRGALGVRLARRVDGRLRERLLRASLASVGIGPLEDKTALEALSEARRTFDSDGQTPGAACAGLLALVARYSRLVGFAVLVGVVTTWVAGVGVVVATMVFRYGQRGGLRKYSQVWSTVIGPRRRSEYLREVALGPAAAKELRVFGITDWFGDRYQSTVEEMLAPVTRRRRAIYLWPYVVITVIGLGIAMAVLAAMAGLAAAGDVSLTGLVLGIQATVSALLLGEYYLESDVPTQYGMQSLTALEEFEAAVGVDAPIPGDAVPDGAPHDAIRFEGVTFRYPGTEHAVLDGLDLELRAGRCTAVVGVNGAGKTTLVKLLTRLHEPSGGRITVDGAPLASLDVVDWRRRTSVVFQNFTRYEMSALENIAMGAAGTPVDRDRALAAAESAGILPVLEDTTHGLDTVLSRAYADGRDLSGGQWQRVAIARSLYALDAGARVLVLDEPTAALDVRAEAAFFARFHELTRGATTLLISHRFSSVRHADDIVVIDAGRVVERGSHDELVAADGRYARLFRLQAERYDDVGLSLDEAAELELGADPDGTTDDATQDAEVLS